MQEVLFYLFSAAMLIFGLLVITNRNPVNSAMFLVLVFFFMAGLFVLLEAFFLAAVQVLVYAGAVMVLFLFVIMLLNVTDETRRKANLFGIVGTFLVVPTLMAEFYLILQRTELKASPSDLMGTTEVVGKLLFSRYLLPFEVASLILLVAMVGVILLSRKETKA
jgi:NADH-quinone oxidoreductase subunit J